MTIDEWFQDISIGDKLASEELAVEGPPSKNNDKVELEVRLFTNFPASRHFMRRCTSYCLGFGISGCGNGKD